MIEITRRQNLKYTLQTPIKSFHFILEYNVNSLIIKIKSTIFFLIVICTLIVEIALIVIFFIIIALVNFTLRYIIAHSL